MSRFPLFMFLALLPLATALAQPAPTCPCQP
jgi:hypothetical protein